MNEHKRNLKGTAKIASLLTSVKEGAVKFADQNDDGKFDMGDVSVVAGNIGQAAKNTASILKENLEAKNRELEMKAL